jgi:hypothetical protein
MLLGVMVTVGNPEGLVSLVPTSQPWSKTMQRMPANSRPMMAPVDAVTLDTLFMSSIS